MDRPGNGRERDEFESLDDGRCCQDRVPDRERAAALCDVGLEGLVFRGADGRENSLGMSSRPGRGSVPIAASTKDGLG